MYFDISNTVDEAANPGNASENISVSTLPKAKQLNTIPVSFNSSLSISVKQFKADLLEDCKNKDSVLG